MAQAHPKNMNNSKTITNDVMYTTNLLEMKVILSMNQIGTNMTKKNLQNTISHFISGKCIEEGYVQPNTINIKSYSSGIMKKDKIEFHVVFECKTYNPVEGSWIHNCKVQSVTKAGIHANVHDKQSNIPATVFIIRDHFIGNTQFNEVKEQDLIDVKVIGTRFELNDSCIEILGNLMPRKK
uniref:Uncharacterized protein n=1 Tax=viral metagenome TaxID=1070528 RepID=A0A6C0CLF7_9ZZZZ